MATSQTRRVVQHLREAVLLHDEDGLTDGQLLERVIDQKDEAAFAVLVRRHGPLVWGVCRRVLLRHHDAEDAFQATFLVLARKAGSILPREMVPNWLYGVAYRTALRARGTIQRRRVREGRVIDMPEPAAAQHDLWRDLGPVLDQELDRLADKYRVAVVLCDLEGKTRKQAARQLKIPEGTLSSRLKTARAMLAKRLARHGFSLSAGAVAVLLSANAVSGSAPSSVVSSTISAATLVATGQAAASGLISVKVATLTEGVLKAMLLTKLKTLTLLIMTTVVLGGVGLVYRTPAAHPASASANPDETRVPEENPSGVNGLDSSTTALAGQSLGAKQPPPQNANTPRADAPEKPPARSITGRILDDQGKPLAKAKVLVQLLERDDFNDGTANRIQEWQVETGSDGTYTVADIKPRGKSLEMDVSARGFVERGFFLGTREFEQRLGSGRFTDVRLQAGVVLTGRCVGPDGKPVAASVCSASGPTKVVIGEMLNVRFGSPERTGDDGRFELTVPKLLKTELVIHPSRWAAQRVVVPEGKSDLGDILLQAGTHITGRVVSREGRTLAGCVVKAEALDAGGVPHVHFPLSAAVKTDAEGRFRLAALPKGDYRVWLPRSHWRGRREAALVTEQPRAVTLPQPQTLDGTKEVVEITIRTVPTVRISGKIVGPDGKPFPGAQVSFSGAEAENESHTQLGETRTDAEGRYVRENIPSGYRTVLMSVAASRGREILCPRPLKHVKATSHPNSQHVTLEGLLDKNLDNVDLELYPMVQQPVQAEPAEAQAVSAVEGEYRQSLTEFHKQVEAGKTDEEKAKLYKDKNPTRQFAERFLKLAEKHQANPEVAIKALTWIVLNVRADFEEADSELFKIQQHTLEWIRRDYARSDQIEPIVGMLPHSFAPPAETLLRSVLKDNPHRSVQGRAAMALAQLLQERARWVEALEELKRKPRKKVPDVTIPAVIAKLTPADAEKMNKEAEHLFEVVAAKYADIEHFSSGDDKLLLGEAAKAALFEIRHLGIGKVAPEIRGEDVEGKPFKLSDYRGKVVLLDFWGHW